MWIALIALLATSAQLGSHALGPAEMPTILPEVQNYTLKWSLPADSEKHFLRAKLQINRMRLGTNYGKIEDEIIYAVCANNVCDLTTRTLGSDKLSFKDTCSGIPTYSPSQGQLIGEVVLLPTIADYHLFLWVSRLSAAEHRLHARLVHTRNCSVAKVEPVRVDEPYYLEHRFAQGPLLDRNLFELLVNDKTVCEGSDRCLVAYNSQGERVGKPALLNQVTGRIVHASPASHFSSMEGYYLHLASPINETSVSSVLVRANPARRPLDQPIALSEPIVNEPSNQRFLHSEHHGSFSFCSLAKGPFAKVDCVLGAGLKGSARLSVELPETRDWAYVQNLPDPRTEEGLLLLTGKCEVVERATRCASFEARKLLRSGELKYRPLEIEGLNLVCDSSDRIDVHVDLDADNYYFYLSCQYGGGKPLPESKTVSYFKRTVHQSHLSNKYLSAMMEGMF